MRSSVTSNTFELTNGVKWPFLVWTLVVNDINCIKVDTYTPSRCCPVKCVGPLQVTNGYRPSTGPINCLWSDVYKQLTNCYAVKIAMCIKVTPVLKEVLWQSETFLKGLPWEVVDMILSLAIYCLIVNGRRSWLRRTTRVCNERPCIMFL